MQDRVEELFSQFQDLFGSMFGGSTTRDVAMELRLALAEAVEGARREVTFLRTTSCPACRGRGGAPGATFRGCVTCAATGGEGRGEGLFFTFAKPCPGCHGRRGTWSPACPGCTGSGIASRRTERVTVTVPAGISHGDVMRVAGKGNDLSDGEGPGDLLLTIVVSPDPRLRREGDDLHVRARVPPALAASGGEVTVTLPSGPRRVRVEPGVRSGDERTLRGWGAVKLGAQAVPIPASDEPYRSVDAREHRGDLVVTFEVDGQPLPEAKLTPDERAAREQARSDARFRRAAIVAALMLALAFACAGLIR